MTKDGLILYHHNSSVCAAKIRVALAEKALDFDSRLLRLDGDQFHPEYLALNPNAVVPTLVHRGRAVIESNIILEYLEDAFPTPPLRPADPHSRAGARQWMAMLDGDGGIHHAASVATYAIAYRHHLIARAGSTDRGPLQAAIKSSMNPKSRSWLQDAVFRGIESAAFSSMNIFAGLLGALPLAAFSVAFNNLALVFMIALGIGTATAVCVPLTRSTAASPEPGPTTVLV